MKVYARWFWVYHRGKLRVIRQHVTAGWWARRQTFPDAPGCIINGLIQWDTKFRQSQEKRFILAAAHLHKHCEEEKEATHSWSLLTGLWASVAFRAATISQSVRKRISSNYFIKFLMSLSFWTVTICDGRLYIFGVWHAGWSKQDLRTLSWALKVQFVRSTSGVCDCNHLNHCNHWKGISNSCFNNLWSHFEAKTPKILKLKHQRDVWLRFRFNNVILGFKGLVCMI